MRLRYARLTTAGQVRPVNEDWLDFWESPDPLERESQGSIALIADGVGGYDHGEVASRLAVEEGLLEFRETPHDLRPYELLRRIFARASAKVHETAAAEHQGRRMATTLVASVFRNQAVHVGNVGDTRAYFIRQKTIVRLTTDHVATQLPVKLGLMLERQAMASPQRSQLTQSVGAEPFCQPSFTTRLLAHGDFILQCTDGLHAYVLDDEMRDLVTRNHPYDACKQLIALAEKRGSDDNISLQLIEVRDWERVAPRLASPGATSAGSSAQQKRMPIAAGTGELTAGMVLDARFELTDLVSRSNMASIFKARDRLSGDSVAVKVPLMALESDVSGFERFKREEEIGARLSHPSVLKVVKVDTPKSRPYLVMEFLDGTTLSEVLSKRGALPESEAVTLAALICDALSHLHANGIAHRDLKPQNIMVCTDGSLRLFDFGIARVEAARRLTFVGLSPTLGTPDYISPEQVRGKRGDSRSDLYSLGAILYQMVTGSAPFEGESPYVVMNARVTGDPPAPSSIKPGINPALEEVILHALERDPRQRYADAAAMKRDLDHLDQVIMTNRAQSLRAPNPWAGRRHLWLVIAAIVLVQIVIFFGLYLMQGHHR